MQLKSITPFVARDKLSLSGQGPWRCDPHPAWSRDGRWLAINVRSNGGMRQVMVFFMGDDLSTYFLE